MCRQTSCSGLIAALTAVAMPRYSDFAQARDAGRRSLNSALGDLAGDQVDFVAGGDRDQQAGVLGAGLRQHAGQRGVADHGADVELLGQLAQALVVGVDHGDVVVLGGQRCRHRGADLPRAENQDLHGHLCGARPADAAAIIAQRPRRLRFGTLLSAVGLDRLGAVAARAMAGSCDQEPVASVAEPTRRTRVPVASRRETARRSPRLGEQQQAVRGILVQPGAGRRQLLRAQAGESRTPRSARATCSRFCSFQSTRPISACGPAIARTRCISARAELLGSSTGWATKP